MWWVVLRKVGVIPAVLECFYGIHVYRTARSGEKHNALFTFLKKLYLAPSLQTNNCSCPVQLFTSGLQ